MCSPDLPHRSSERRQTVLLLPMCEEGSLQRTLLSLLSVAQVANRASTVLPLPPSTYEQRAVLFARVRVLRPLSPVWKAVTSHWPQILLARVRARTAERDGVAGYDDCNMLAIQFVIQTNRSTHARGHASIPLRREAHHPRFARRRGRHSIISPPLDPNHRRSVAFRLATPDCTVLLIILFACM